MRRPRLLPFLLATLLVVMLLPGSPAAAAETYEVHYIDSVGGAVLRVEVLRDTSFDAMTQPVLLQYSPYHNLDDAFTGGEPARVGEEWLSKGYAFASADVLGTRGSTGCWDYGGDAEQQSGVDVVNFLSGLTPNTEGEFLTWSNGNVGMLGVSYNGTTPTMVAAAGDAAPGLKAIVPIAAISRWYGYAFHDGVRYLTNDIDPTSQGHDTPLAFDLGFGRTVVADPEDPRFADAAAARAAECDAAEHIEQGYERSPDYDEFWTERDYRLDVAEFNAAVFVVHGWQDYNVKQEEGLALFESVPVDDPATETVEGVPFKVLYLHQGAHSDGQGPLYQPLLEDFLAQTLDPAAHEVETGFLPGSSDVYTLGRTADGAMAPTAFTADAQWPLTGTAEATLHLGRTFDQDLPMDLPPPGTGETGTLNLEPQDDGAFTYVDTGVVTEPHSYSDPLNGPGHGYYSLFHQSAPLAADTRMAGRAFLDAVVNLQNAGQHLTPVLVEVLASGDIVPVTRGFLNADYRDGLGTAEPAPGEWVQASVRFLPQDYTFSAGSRVGLVLQSSNTIWARPNSAGQVLVAMGPLPDDGVAAGTALRLPFVNAAQPLFTAPETAGASSPSSSSSSQVLTAAPSNVVR